MATMRSKRPPAQSIPIVEGRPPATFVASPRSTRGFSYQWIDTTTVPPVLEQPRLILNSAAQPFVRWGHRRYVRTHMRASLPFTGRFAFAGAMMNRFLERNKQAGVQSRGTTYAWTPPPTGPGPSRTVQLRGPSVGR
jgi:hypothetical protein